MLKTVSSRKRRSQPYGALASTFNETRFRVQGGTRSICDFYQSQPENNDRNMSASAFAGNKTMFWNRWRGLTSFHLTFCRWMINLRRQSRISFINCFISPLSSMHWYKWTHVGAVEPRVPLQESERPVHELHICGREPRNHVDPERLVRLELLATHSRSDGKFIFGFSAPSSCHNLTVLFRAMC